MHRLDENGLPGVSGNECRPAFTAREDELAMVESETSLGFFGTVTVVAFRSKERPDRRFEKLQIFGLRRVGARSDRRSGDRRSSGKRESEEKKSHGAGVCCIQRVGAGAVGCSLEAKAWTNPCLSASPVSCTSMRVRRLPDDCKKRTISSSPSRKLFEDPFRISKPASRVAKPGGSGSATKEFPSSQIKEFSDQDDAESSLIP